MAEEIKKNIQGQMEGFVDHAKKQGFKINPETNEVINPTQELMNQFNQQFTTTPSPIEGSGSFIEQTANNFDNQIKSEQNTFTVAEGSNLTRSAQSMGISLEQLLEANPQFKANPDFVRAGAQLKFPTSTTDETITDESIVDEAPKTVQTSEALRAEERKKEIERIKAELEPDIDRPTFKSLEEFDRLRKEGGIVKDEEELQAIQQEALLGRQELREFRASAGEGVTEAGRIGAVSEAERNLNFRLEGLSIREQGVVSRLNSKNSYISTVLKLGQQDFNTALTEYNDEYNKNVKAIDVYNAEIETEKKDALAGFTTITNLLQDNNVDLESIDPALASQITSLELQAGLPEGTFEAISTAKPDDKILPPITVKNADDSESVYFFTQSEDGTPTLVKSIGLGGGTGGGGSGNIINPEFSGIIGTILGSGKFTKQQATAITNAINTGEDPLIVVKNQAKNLMGSSAKKDLIDIEKARDAMVTLEGNVKDFYAAGGKSGIFKGNFEKVTNKLGGVKDPGLVSLSVKIAASLQKYRNAISGTAYSEQEGRDIAAIFPGIIKGELLNNTIIRARLENMDSDINSAYESVLGSGYQNLRNVAGGGSDLDIEDLSFSLDSRSGADGFVHPDDWATMKNLFISHGGTSDEFDQQFETYKNPNNPNYQ